MRRSTNQPAHSPKTLPRIQMRLLLAVLVLSGSVSSRSQSPDSAQVTHEPTGDQIAANDPRPLKAVVRSLEETYGWTVDYEEPTHRKDSPDVLDMTDPTWRRAHPNDQFIALTRGSFTTHLTPGETEVTAAPLQTVRRIVDEYDATSLPGRFAVRAGAAGRIAVVGIAARTSAGAYERQPVLLDTVLDLPSSTSDLYEALMTITGELAKLSGHRVVLGTSPINIFNQVHCVISKEELPARNIIGKLLSSAPVELAYVLLYDLNDDLYVLNVTVVTRATTNARGVEQRIAVRLPK